MFASPVIALRFTHQLPEAGCSRFFDRLIFSFCLSEETRLYIYKTIYTFTNPLDNMEQTTLQATKTKKVLIVEDEGDMCLLLNILLNGKEMELEHVKNLSDAKEYLEQEQPAVVLLDNKLPDGFGVDFIRFLKQHYPAVKIVMISGYDGSVEDVAMENGADVFLQKPFTRDQLYQSIKGLMN